VEKITLGPPRHILLNPVDRECTAYHESGHARLGLLVPGSDPVHRVAIVPRGMALGATYQLPTDDRISYAEDYLRARTVNNGELPSVRWVTNGLGDRSRSPCQAQGRRFDPITRAHASRIRRAATALGNMAAPTDGRGPSRRS
jgi:hypothetical protein